MRDVLQQKLGLYHTSTPSEVGRDHGGYVMQRTMVSVSAASLTETVCTISLQRVISHLRLVSSGDKSGLTPLSSRQVNQIAPTSRKLSLPTTNRRLVA